MSKKVSFSQQDLRRLLSPNNGEVFPFENARGLWYVFANQEKGIRSKASTNHSWLRLVGLKVIEKQGVPFDPVVEPIFLRTSHPGEPPDCVPHNSHAHASQSGCVLYRPSYVWLNVDRNMEPGIRDYEKTAELDRRLPFCTEDEAIFLSSFTFWLGENGAKFDFSESGI
jgi:hypothetical protein